jgi:hypothetical protein
MTEASFTTAPPKFEAQVSMNLGAKPVRFAGTRSGPQRGSWRVQKVSQMNLPLS